MVVMGCEQPRVLLLAPDKGLAEVIFRGISGIRGIDIDVEVVFTEAAARDLVATRHYDLFVVGSENGLLAGPLATFLPSGLPTVAVGGDPVAGALRVPLPLSLRLLERAVLRALRGEDDRGEAPARRRDSIG